jgi:lipopolysaccharide assembly protein A
MESEQQPQPQGLSTPNDLGESEPTATGSGEPTVAPAPAPTPSPPPTGVPPSRAGRLWVGLIPALIFLIVMLVFIFQNLHNVKISFFTASGSFPLALALLLAAVLGALIVLCLGSIRILQLRRTVRRRSRMARAADSQPL